MAMNIEIKEVETKEESKEKNNEQKIILLGIDSIDRHPEDKKTIVQANIIRIDTNKQLGCILFESNHPRYMRIEAWREFIKDPDGTIERNIVFPIDFTETQNEGILETSISHILLKTQELITDKHQSVYGKDEICVFSPDILKRGSTGDKLYNVLSSILMEIGLGLTL